MKITDIKTLVVNAEMRNWVFVKLETDSPGLYGWGEGTMEWKTRAALAPPVANQTSFSPCVTRQVPLAANAPSFGRAGGRPSAASRLQVAPPSSVWIS